MYDVSTPDDTAPEPGMYDGDTSVYCPVSFANGKIAIGSKKHMAVYRNRYYYMSSTPNLKAFVSNPYKYTSLTGDPEDYPKPKITVLSAFGSDPADLIGDLSDAFGLTAMDWRKTFADVVPDCMPMLGQMYEEPVLRLIVDEHLVPGSRDCKDRVADLRRYVDRESVRLSDGDFATMNSGFAQSREGICYNNWPRNPAELQYACENGTGPDAIVRVVADGGRDDRERARQEAAANWLVYQYALVDRAIDRDDAARRDAVARRRVLFREGLVATIHGYKMAEVRARLTNVIDMIAAETADGLAMVEQVCRRLNSDHRNGEPAAPGRTKTSKW